MQQKYIKEGIFHFLGSLILGSIIGTLVITLIPNGINISNIALKGISEISLLLGVALNSLGLQKKNNINKSGAIWLSLILYIIFVIGYFSIFGGSLIIEFVYLIIISLLYRYIGITFANKKD